MPTYSYKCKNCGEELDEFHKVDDRYNQKCPKCEKVEISSEMPKCPKCDVYMTPAGSVTWDEEKAKKVVKDVHMGEKMKTLCRTTLQKLSNEKTMTEQHYSLFEKFVKAEEEAD